MVNVRLRILILWVVKYKYLIYRPMYMRVLNTVRKFTMCRKMWENRQLNVLIWKCLGRDLDS